MSSDIKKYFQSYGQWWWVAILTCFAAQGFFLSEYCGKKRKENDWLPTEWRTEVCPINQGFLSCLATICIILYLQSKLNRPLVLCIFCFCSTTDRYPVLVFLILLFAEVLTTSLCIASFMALVHSWLYCSVSWRVEGYHNRRHWKQMRIATKTRFIIDTCFSWMSVQLVKLTGVFNAFQSEQVPELFCYV